MLTLPLQRVSLGCPGLQRLGFPPLLCFSVPLKVLVGVPLPPCISVPERFWFSFARAEIVPLPAEYSLELFCPSVHVPKLQQGEAKINSRFEIAGRISPGRTRR